jgi:Glycosyl hydrolases family 35/Beta-galactosidase jelly roll domain
VIDWSKRIGILTREEQSTCCFSGLQRSADQRQSNILKDLNSVYTKRKSRRFGKIHSRANFLQVFGRLFFVALAWPLLFSRVSAQPARPFVHPDRIRYDSQCLTIDGKDIFIYSGAFHYFRCPKELWPDRFQKIKDAGFNTVETYVPWNWCERQMPDGVNDFSKVDLKDFDDWLTMAEHFGFYIIVRPGPYICAEWDTGGYPQWLLTKKPENPLRSQAWLRSDDPVYLSWSKHWYDAVCPVIARHQITRKAPGQPGVILVQVENEYDFGPPFPDEVRINQVKALAQYARADGIDVPLITCWTHVVRGSADPILRQIFDCCNFYPRWAVEDTLKNMEELRPEQPDAPMATTELQGGWFANVGGQLSQDQDGLTGSQINNLTLFVMEHGETILNYYMLFGGTNPDDWAARDITSTYDYNAPIREWGGAGDRYQRVSAIGHMLQEHGVRLARSSAVDCHVTTTQNDITVVERRALDGSRYFFVRTSQNRESRQGTATVRAGFEPPIVFDYDLEPFGAKILYLPPGVHDASAGEWLPKAMPPIERPADLPAGVAITSARMRNDPGPAHWTRIKSGEALARAGIYDSHFIFYRAQVSCATATNLLVNYPDGDAVATLVNGHPIAQMGSNLRSALFNLPAGVDSICLLYENHGHLNGGAAMENPCGIRAIRLTGSALANGTPIAGWRMQIVNGTDNRPEVASYFNDTAWSPEAVDNLEANQLTPNQDAVFRAGVDLTAADLNTGKMALSFGRVDDYGWVYVNGTLIGHTTDWSLAYSFDVTRVLHPGRNVIAVVVQNVGGGGGIGLPALTATSDNPPVRLQSFGRPAGDEEQWWKSDLDDASWTSIAIGQTNAPSPDDSVLTWYRMSFSLPSPQPGVWVPWRLHLMASGNGFVYFNGHPLGRYWNVGPQHDFFLPECWLHFGDGQSNNLTLNLRPTGGDAAIQSAIVEPYSDFAENR